MNLTLCNRKLSSVEILKLGVNRLVPGCSVSLDYQVLLSMWYIFRGGTVVRYFCQ